MKYNSLEAAPPPAPQEKKTMVHRDNSLSSWDFQANVSQNILISQNNPYPINSMISTQLQSQSGKMRVGGVVQCVLNLITYLCQTRKFDTGIDD